MKILGGIAIAIGLVVTTSVEADKAVMGFGESTCGTWTAMRAQKRSPMEYWALGFVSGWNHALQGPDILKDVDANKVLAWLDDYCQIKPLEPFTMAAHQLAIDLMFKPHKTTPQKR